MKRSIEAIPVVDQDFKDFEAKCKGLTPDQIRRDYNALQKDIAYSRNTWGVRSVSRRSLASMRFIH